MQAAVMFGKLLNQSRLEKKLSKEKMAELCGVSARHYINLEQGIVNTKLETAVRISSTTGISLDSLKKTGE